VPGDWPSLDGHGWFHDGAPPTAGSDVQYLIDGPQTFEAMAEAMETADSKEHFIILLAWSLDPNLRLTPGGKTFLQTAEEKATLKVAVRVLLFDNMAYKVNGSAKGHLDRLRTDKNLDVYCNLDDNVNGLAASAIASVAGKAGVHSYGAHHHKILIVRGREGLVAFCGGVDVDANRLQNSSLFLHDVHVRVTGEAAMDLFNIAEQRWNSSSDGGNPPEPSGYGRFNSPSVGLSVPSPTGTASSSATPYLARVVQTVGNPTLAKTIPNTLWPAVQRAIRKASKFIYIEDQYFWSLELVAELVEASKRVRRITVVLPPALFAEHPYMRQSALAELVRLGGPGVEKKIGIFQAAKPRHEFVHAKLFVFDDEYAFVGSANANNRGYFLDSEAAVGVTERARHMRHASWYAVEANFARRMRIELWREHLGLEADELFDGLAAHVHWESLPAFAQVQIYRAANLKKLPVRLEESDLSHWWNAPYDAWDPGYPAEHLLVDPKS